MFLCYCSLCSTFFFPYQYRAFGVFLRLLLLCRLLLLLLLLLVVLLLLLLRSSSSSSSSSPSSSSFFLFFIFFTSNGDHIRKNRKNKITLLPFSQLQNTYSQLSWVTLSVMLAYLGVTTECILLIGYSACYLEFKLRLKNRKLFSTRVKELFEPIVL